MPIYDFECCHCHKQFESIEKQGTDFAICECGYTAKKIVSRFTFQLKGDCWEKDGYASHKENALDRVPK